VVFVVVVVVASAAVASPICDFSRRLQLVLLLLQLSSKVRILICLFSVFVKKIYPPSSQTFCCEVFLVVLTWPVLFVT
jgi:hypothetical protein